jgi:hypothetical protein
MLQELCLDPVVMERENAARRKLHETEQRHPVVRERENASCQELHETERRHPVVPERENTEDCWCRHGEENNEIGRGAITDTDVSMEDFTDHIRKDKNGESFSFTDKNVDNALALFCANMGHHRFGQHLKFQDPPVIARIM